MSRAASGSPFTVTTPSDAWSTPASTLSMVLLPAPLSPMIATSSPGSSDSEADWRIVLSPTRTEIARASMRSAPASLVATTPSALDTSL